MRKCAWLLILIGFSGFAGSPVCGDANQDARTAIRTAYRKLDNALMRKDVPASLAIHTADYKSVDEKGKVSTIQQQREELMQVFPMARSIYATTTLLKLTLKGGSAIVTNKGHTVVVVNDPKSKKSCTMTADETCEDLWVKTGRGWLLKHSKTLTLKTNIKQNRSGGSVTRMGD